MLESNWYLTNIISKVVLCSVAFRKLDHPTYQFETAIFILFYLFWQENYIWQKAPTPLFKLHTETKFQVPIVDKNSKTFSV